MLKSFWIIIVNSKQPVIFAIQFRSNSRLAKYFSKISIFFLFSNLSFLTFAILF